MLDKVKGNQSINPVSLNLPNSPSKPGREVNLLKFTISKRDENCM